MTNTDAYKYPVVEGFCPICLAPFFNIKGELLETAVQFEILLSSGQVTAIGVCSNCFKKINIKQVRAIFAGIVDHWQKGGFTYKGTVKKLLKKTVSKMKDIE